jgi:hypothetical protein
MYNGLYFVISTTALLNTYVNRHHLLPFQWHQSISQGLILSHIDQLSPARDRLCQISTVPFVFACCPIAPPPPPIDQLSFAIVRPARSQSNGTKMVPVYTKLRSVVTVNLVSLINQWYQLKISSTKIGTDYECTKLL